MMLCTLGRLVLCTCRARMHIDGSTHAAALCAKIICQIWLRRVQSGRKYAPRQADGQVGGGCRSWPYLFGRLFDKTCFAFLTATFYWRTGSVMSAANAPNLAGLLFMW